MFIISMDYPNVYLTIITIGIIIFITNKFLPQKEHFGNPIALLKKIGQGLVDFFLNFIDILLVIADVFSFIALIPFIIMDLVMILITWLWPISMIKGVVSSIFIMTKILFLMIFDFAIHLLRMFFAKMFGLLKGGLWGIPHGPDQHFFDNPLLVDSDRIHHDSIESGFADRFGDHHHDHSMKREDYRYRPLRCYQSVGSEGFINMVSTIICPPLGVFMSFGISGWLKILVCCALSLMYYVPGLVYALLVTTHLGLGRKITAKDCGGLPNYGIRIAGCTGINNEIDCKAATIPGWRDANGGEIRSCGWVKDDNNLRGGKCYNIIYPSAVHTTGRTVRNAHEIGTVEAGYDDNIDHTTELGTDKYIDDDKNKGIDYNPIGLAEESHEDTDVEEETILDDKVKIPQGPWKYVGGD